MTSSAPTIGIVTGSGPDAGLDLWQKVLDARRATGDYTGDTDAPRVVIVSEPELGHSMSLPDSDATVWPALEATVRQLSPQVDRYAIACNTLNVCAPRLRELGLSAELVTYPGALRAWAHERHIERFALLGAGPVAALDEWSAYADLTNDFDLVTPLNPTPLHDLIQAIKVDGGADPRHGERLAEIIKATGSTVAALACTELPLVAIDLPDHTLVDVTTLVASRLLF